MIVERSLSDENIARSLNNLSKSTQQLPRSLSDLSMIVQWSPQLPRSPQSFDSVQSNLSVITKGSDLSTNAQQTLNKCSRSAQWSYQSLSDLSSIFQWPPNFSTPKGRWLRDQWQWVHKDLTQKCLFCRFWNIVERLGLFLIAQWSPNNLRPM